MFIVSVIMSSLTLLTKGFLKDNCHCKYARKIKTSSLASYTGADLSVVF